MNETLEQDSILTKQQYKSEGPRAIDGYAKGAALWAHLRYDDQCGNGHNSFGITGTVREPGKRDIAAGGCLHDDIARVFPELATLIKWHLCSSDGPMHYLANTLYLAGDVEWNNKTKARDFDAARSTAIWPEATDEQLSLPREELESLLVSRLPGLLIEFRAAMESIGFTW